MEVIRKPIKSARTTADARPWFDIAVDGDAINVGLGNHKGKALPQKAMGRINRSQFQAASKRMVPPETLVVAAVTLDGTLVVEPPGESGPEYLGILAIYNTVTDTLEVLEFGE